MMLVGNVRIISAIIIIVKNMKLQRKLKKKIIKTFGRSTYVGIINGYLTLKRYSFNGGVETIYTDKPMIDKIYYAHQYNPYVEINVYVI